MNPVALPKNDFIDALVAGNRFACSKIIRTLLKDNVPIIDIFEQVITQALYGIGDLWMSGKISVATEHLAAAMVEGILNELFSDIISNKKTGQTAVLACVENENHQIGLKMVSDIFDKNGWNTFYIGASVPVEDLIWFIKEKTPDVLVLSISLTYNTQYLEQAIQKIHALFPNQMILIGGQGLWKGKGELLQDGKKILYIPDLYVLELYFAK